MNKLVIIIGITALCVYYFLAAQPLEKENYLTVGISKASTVPDQAILPIKVDNKLSYLSSDLKIAHQVVSGDQIAYSPQYYTMTTPDLPYFTLYTASGKMINRIYDDNVPVIFDDKIFTINYEEGFITHYDKEGAKLWSYHTGAFITTLMPNETSVALGLINGDIIILDHLGQQIALYHPGGSQIHAIYGIAISSDGQYIATISGLNPQRFLLLRKGNYDYTPIYDRHLNTQFSRAVQIRFDKNNSQVFYEENGFINTYSIKDKKWFHIPVVGEMVSFSTDLFDHYFTYLTKDVRNNFYLHILDKKTTFPLVHYQFVENRYTSLVTLNNKVVIGLPSSLLNINLEVAP
jgi:hypothetical protein